MAEDALLKRVLPHSIEAEQSVIGSMIMDREAITVASELICGDDFYGKQYGVVFDTMVELNDEGKPVDLITLQDRLREKDVPPEVSSLEFIRDLITAVPTSANIKYYAGIVAEKATLRKLIRLNEEIANTCYAGKENLEVILEDTEKRVFELVQKRNTGEFVPIRQVVMNAMDKIEKASKSDGNVTGIATGFIDLDFRTAGMQPSDLILVAARPSMGKTAFVLNIAQHVAFKLNQTVAIFSLEMSKEQLVNRLFSLESRVDSQHLRTGNLRIFESFRFYLYGIFRVWLFFHRLHTVLKRRCFQIQYRCLPGRIRPYFIHRLSALTCVRYSHQRIFHRTRTVFCKYTDFKRSIIHLILLRPNFSIKIHLFSPDKGLSG